MPTFSLALFGPYTATLDDRSLLPFRTNRVQALLSYLAVEHITNPGIAHRRERLMELLWPGLPSVSSRDNLRVTLHRLRKAVPQVVARQPPYTVDFVLADRQSIQLNPAATWQLDVAHFQQRLAGTPTQADLAAALALYRGDFLADFYLPDSDEFETWAANWRALLQRQALDALESLTEDEMAQGHYREAEAHARRQLALDNLRESAQRQLMAALFLQGSRNEALAQYERCRRLLWTELAVEPAPETQHLGEAIRNGQLARPSLHQPAVAKASPPVPSARPVMVTAPPHNLPVRTSPFVGRSQELATLDKLITAATTRLITIVGIGGMGKTRLALAAAERQWQRTSAQIATTDSPTKGIFPDGVYFVGLEAVNHATQIVFAITQALDFPLRGELEPAQQLLNYLRPKQLLLVLDNFEHLLDGVDFLITLVTHAPSVQLLVTSREQLSLPDEQLLTLTGLEWQAWTRVEEAEQFAAVQLFMQSARRRRPDFVLTAADLPALVQICQWVGGMPLGLELAAAWVDTLPLTEIARQAEQSAEVLETTLRHLPERHRSIRAVLDAAWQRLSEPERSMFAQLACFRGGFTREAALSVLQLPNHAAVTLRHLAELVHKALLQFDAANDRYFVHELLRQYGAEQLRQQPAVEAAVYNRHSAFYCAWLSQREAELKGAREQTALAAIEADYGNVRAAWAWAVAHRCTERLAQAGDTFALYAEYRGYYQEAEAALASATRQLQSLGSESPDAVATERTIAGLLTWQALFTHRQGRFAEASNLLQHSLRILEQPALVAANPRHEQAALFWHMALLAAIAGKDRTVMRQLYEQALALYQALDDAWGAANALEFLGEWEADEGNLAAALCLQEECLALRQHIGNLRSVAHSLHQVASILQFQGDWAKAEQLMRQSLALHQQINDKPGIAQRLTTLSWTLRFAGKLQEAVTTAQQSLQRHRQLGNRFFMAIAYSCLVENTLHLGQYAEAQRLAQENLQSQQEQDVNRGAHLMTLCRTQIACQQYEAALHGVASVQRLITQGGYGVNPWEIESALAQIAYHVGKFQQSRQHVMNALQLVVTHQSPYAVIEVILSNLPFIALAGQKAQVLELCSLATYYPLFTQSQWYQEQVWRTLPKCLVNLSAAEVAAAQIRRPPLEPWAAARQLMQALLNLAWPPTDTTVRAE